MRLISSHGGEKREHEFDKFTQWRKIVHEPDKFTRWRKKSVSLICSQGGKQGARA